MELYKITCWSFIVAKILPTGESSTALLTFALFEVVAVDGFADEFSAGSSPSRPGIFGKIYYY
jgi:hypothetical protein